MSIMLMRPFSAKAYLESGNCKDLHWSLATVADSPLFINVGYVSHIVWHSTTLSVMGCITGILYKSFTLNSPNISKPLLCKCTHYLTLGHLQDACSTIRSLFIMRSILGTTARGQHRCCIQFAYAL